LALTFDDEGPWVWANVVEGQNARSLPNERVGEEKERDEVNNYQYLAMDAIVWIWHG
jgi:hypothetical protein